MVSRFVSARFVTGLLLSLMLPLAQARAQDGAPSSPVGSKKPLTIADYSRWRSIEGAELSPDGK